MNLNQLIDRIFELDKIMVTSLIDINQPDWMKIARKAQTATSNEDMLKDLVTHLIASFRQLKKSERELFWKNLSKTQHIQYLISSNYLVDKSPENLLLLEIIIDLMPDPRDRLLDLNQLLDEFESTQVDYQSTISQLLEYADSNDWCGMGSMQSFLKKLL